MSDSIGVAAGKIWDYLNENGEASVTKITKETGLNKNEVQRAVGWLAKENKLTFTMDKRTELLSLK